MEHTCPTGASTAAFDVVAVATSAGGLAALCSLLSALPADFPAAVLVVQHLIPSRHSLLPGILGRHSHMRVREARDGEALARATVYVAPADQHLLVTPGGTISLSHTRAVHFVRPSADILFESVAGSFGGRAIAVVLTGTGIDGSCALEAIKEQGGVVLAQDPATSEFVGMPEAAIKTGHVDRVLSLSGISAALTQLVNTGTLE